MERVLYGYTNSDKRDDLLTLTKKLGSYYKTTKSVTLKDLSFTNALKFADVKKIGSGKNDLAHKVSYLKNLDKLVRAESEKVSQVNISTLLRDQTIEVFNSEGLYATDRRPYVRLMTTAITKDGNNQATGFYHPGGFGGFELIEKLNLAEHASYITKQSLTNLYAKPCPAGKMAVVIDNGFGGVIFHEACGHLLETTAVEKKSTVFWDKMGEKIAHEAVSAVDDGTIDYEWGSLSIDDEGMKTERTQLIKNGILTDFMCDYVGHLKTGYRRTGSGRKQSYKFAPASRMRNTFIEPGKYNLDELIASMDDGLYAKTMGGGSVKGSGEFNFSVQEGYLVKNGKITDTVKGATLIGRGEDIMQKISMVGNNFSLATGMCGSVSGSIPTTVGQAALKVDDILVGGGG
ncbi:MAG: TldD/PmbA family protein [Bacteriovoracaceae bacterium]